MAVRKGWVAGYIQLSPLTRVPVLNDKSELSWRGPVFLFEPTAFAAQVFPRTIRRKLKAAQCLQPTLVDDTQALAPRLVDLYPRTLPRGAAAAGKHFSLAILDRWARDSDSLLLGASVGGSVKAVILFRRAGGHAEAHVLGHTERGRQLDAWPSSGCFAKECRRSTWAAAPARATA